MLKKYQADEHINLEIRMTYCYYGLYADDAIEIGKTNPDCLFRILDDYSSVALLTSKDFCETVEWCEQNPEESTSDGSYSFFMDRVLSPEEQEEYIISI